MYLYVHKPVASKTHFLGWLPEEKHVFFKITRVFSAMHLVTGNYKVKLWEITGTVNCEQITALRIEICKTGFLKKMRCHKIFNKTVFFFRCQPPKQWVKGAIGT